MADLAQTTPFALSEAIVKEVFALRPLTATFYGISGYDHLWDDFSPEGLARVALKLRDFQKQAHALPPQTDKWLSLAVLVIKDWLERELLAFDSGDHYTDLNTIASTFQLVRMAFDSMESTSVKGWENIVCRLETIDFALGGYQKTLQAGLSIHRVVAARQVKAAILQGRIHAGERSFFHSLLGSFNEKKLHAPALFARLEAVIPKVCAAYGAFADWLETAYLPHAKREDGVGKERYLREMRHFLGSVPDPLETYHWGFSEVARISAEMRRVAAIIDKNKSVSEVIAFLRQSPEHTAKDRKTFLAAIAERQEKALSDLSGTHFVIPEQVRRLDIKEAPPGGPLGAYYVPPSEDFSRPGTLWYSLGEEGPFSFFEQVSTSYHEGFPGHHLQHGIQAVLTKQLCRLHRVAYSYSGYAEGWALYVERLMGELGYYEKPEYELGMLVNQMARACRVVFDIGAHLQLKIPDDATFHPGEDWTFDLGVELMMTMGGLASDHAHSEITRYLGWPAQAISYKVGERVILDIRDVAVKQGKTLAEIHSLMLGCGNVSLGLLRDYVLG